MNLAQKRLGVWQNAGRGALGRAVFESLLAAIFGFLGYLRMLLRGDFSAILSIIMLSSAIFFLIMAILELTTGRLRCVVLYHDGIIETDIFGRTWLLSFHDVSDIIWDSTDGIVIVLFNKGVHWIGRYQISSNHFLHDAEALSFLQIAKSELAQYKQRAG